MFNRIFGAIFYYLKVLNVKRLSLLLLLAFSLTTTCFAQNRELIDSLRGVLTTAKDLQRYHVLNDLAWEYRWSTPDSTIALAQKGYDLGMKLNLQTGLAEPLNFIGVAYNYKGDKLQAFDFYDKALKLSIQQKDTLQIAYSNNNLGRLLFEQGLLSRSYDYFVKALVQFEAINDLSGIAYTYQSLANLYKLQRDFAKAENHYLKAYKIRLALGNTRDIMSALVQVGRLYQEISQHDKALKFLHLADSSGHIINDEVNLADIKTYIAESYLQKGLLKEANEMATEGLKVIVSKNIVRMLPQAYVTMGQIKIARKEYAEARLHLYKALEISTRTKDLTAKMDAHYWLWKLSEKQNDVGGKLKNQNEYLILKDSIKDLDLTRQIERLQFEIEIERKEQENDLLKERQATDTALIQQQKLQNIILIVIIASVSALGLVQWRNNKKKREANEKLAQQNQFIQNQREEIIQQNEKLFRRNQELSDLNNEKDTLMSIVAHDLKSPLNRIKGVTDILYMEGTLTDSQKQYMQLVKDATQSGLDLIKDLLDVHMLEENIEPNLSTFDISGFLLQKTEYHRQSAEAKNIHLHISRIENEMVTLDADYLSRIMDNLISNAIKFSNKNAEVEIAAGKNDSEIWISVKDQGPGFSEKDKSLLFQKFRKLTARPTAGETSNGLGLAIVKTLIDRLRGQIDLRSENGKGSEFIIRFPLNHKN